MISVFAWWPERVPHFVVESLSRSGRRVLFRNCAIHGAGGTLGAGCAYQGADAARHRPAMERRAMLMASEAGLTILLWNDNWHRPLRYHIPPDRLLSVRLEADSKKVGGARRRR